MKDKKVKTISIATFPGFFEYGSDDVFSEELKIFRNQVVYKKEDIINGKIQARWKFTTTSDKFSDTFRKICDEVQKFTDFYADIDCPGFSLEIFYSDETSKICFFPLNFDYNKMDYLTLLIKTLIPVGESYPKVLDYDSFLD